MIAFQDGILAITEEEQALLSHPDSDKGKLQRIALAYLRLKNERDEIPTNIRFVFYELEQKGILSKKPLRRDGKPSKRKPAQNLTDAITWLREAELVDWDWIVDESRKVDAWRIAPTVAEYVAESVDLAAIDRFPGVPRPVLLCESRATGGVLERTVARDYRVTVAPTGGQCAGFLVNEVAPYLVDPKTCVRYLGDWDLAGNDIEANTRRVLERHTGRTFDATTWKRILLTDRQVEELRRKGVEPVEKRDERFKDGHPHQAFEAEALGQAYLTGIVRRQLAALAPVPLKDVLEREVKERAAVLKLLRGEPPSDALRRRKPR
jgi:hypothetical protein